MHVLTLYLFARACIVLARATGAVDSERIEAIVKAFYHDEWVLALYRSDHR